ncbi:hypothetical protein JTB14_025348 [Gonioctena quinquepunctata]|nr:hypothetical protein JTB14_025348 [Gonioctena quinquepunctata]
MMFCGGSFRSKTIEKNDEYHCVKVNDRIVKIMRTASLSAADRSSGRRIFVLPPKVPLDANKIYFKPHLVSNLESGINLRDGVVEAEKREIKEFAKFCLRFEHEKNLGKGFRFGIYKKFATVW